MNPTNLFCTSLETLLNDNDMVYLPAKCGQTSYPVPELFKAGLRQQARCLLDQNMKNVLVLPWGGEEKGVWHPFFVPIEALRWVEGNVMDPNACSHWYAPDDTSKESLAR